MYQKKKIFKSEKYRKFIRNKACLCCESNEGVEFHHEDDDFYNSGMAIKPPDTQGLPLCGKCHIHKRHNMPAKEFWSICNVDPKVKMVNYLNEFLTGGENE